MGHIIEAKKLGLKYIGEGIAPKICPQCDGSTWLHLEQDINCGGAYQTKCSHCDIYGRTKIPTYHFFDPITKSTIVVDYIYKLESKLKELRELIVS